MSIDLPAARQFLYANARLLELRVYECRFDGADPAHVTAAVAAYQNDDGGFGHGLEPDARTPHSQPLDVQVALERLLAVGAPAGDIAVRACDHLTAVSDATGAVPVLLASIAGYPRAAHWAQADTFPPSLNPTAAIAGHLHQLGVAHEWVDRATEHCYSVLETDGPPLDAHALLCVSTFLHHAPDRDRASKLIPPAADAVPRSAMFQLMPDAAEYGVTPLHFAPTPTSPARSWFDDATIAAHLDDLERQQAADGGWPIQWQPPSEATRCEWRAICTLEAIQTLVAYGRIRG